MRALYWVLFALGFSSMIVQLTVLREFYSVFYGNELVFGIVLGNWLLLTAFGSFLGRHSKSISSSNAFFIAVQALLAFLMPFTLFLAGLCGTLSAPGEMSGLSLIFFSTLAVLAPFCLLSGFQVVHACRIISEKSKSSFSKIGAVYSAESFGSLAGGMLFSYILIRFLDSFAIMWIAFFANILVCILLARSMLAGTERKVFYLVFAILLFSSIILQSQSNLTSVINGIQFPGQEVLFQKNSLYGDIVVTKTGGQVNFFENSIPLFSSENTMQNEESVHYAMVQHENPRRVLLISGGVSGTLKEILKYNVDEVDYVELDPLLVEVGRVYAPSSGVENPKVRTISIDGRFFVKQSTGSFDVVLLAVGDPTTAQAGRYYTLEFFNDLKKLVGSDGVISVPLVSSENYVGAEKRMLNSCVFKTLRQVFKNIIVIPGDRSFLIASDKELTYDIAGKIRQRNLDTLYVNEGYLKGRLTEERINYALDSMSDESAMLNTDFKPAAYYYYLAYWTRYFHLNINYLAITVLLLFALFFARMRPLPAVVSSAGFAGASMQIILVLCFQVLYGQAYYKIGSIVACFMLGLALGAGYAYHRLKSKPLSLSLIILCLAACCFALPIAVLILSKTTSTLTQILFPLFSVAFGLMAGMLFPTAAEVYIRYRKDSAEKVMGVLYSADLFGAFFGSTVVSIFLVPIYGIISSCLLVGLLCLFSWYLISSRNEKEKT